MNKMIENQIAVAFWEAMEENERNFQSYLASNPTPFEKFNATREYHMSRLENERKFVDIMSSFEDDGDEEYIEETDFAFVEGTNQKSVLISKLREFRNRLFEEQQSSNCEGITISVVRGDETLTFHIDHKTFEVLDCIDEFGKAVTPTNKEKDLAIELAKGGYDETGR